MVNKIKNKEIPSIPKEKFILDPGSHEKVSTNWNWADELSNLIHKGIEMTKFSNDILKAKSLINCVLYAGINNSRKTPHIGRVIRVESSEFIMKIFFTLRGENHFPP